MLGGCLRVLEAACSTPRNTPPVRLQSNAEGCPHFPTRGSRAAKGPAEDGMGCGANCPSPRV